MRILALLPGLVFLGLLGCSSPKSETPPPLKISYPAWPGFDILSYGKKAGIFKKHGVEVELVRFDHQPDSNRAFYRGRADIVLTSLWDLMHTQTEGEEPVVFLVTNVSHGADGIAAAKGIESVSDLKGKKVAAKLRSTNHLILIEALTKYGLSLDDVEVVDVSNEKGKKDLADGKVSAAVLWQPMLGESAREVEGKIIFTTADVESLVIDVGAVHPSVIRERKSDLIKLMRAWRDIIAKIESEPDVVFSTAGEAIGQSGADFARDYAGLKKGNLALMQSMFGPKGQLSIAMPKIVTLLKRDDHHRSEVRETVTTDSSIFREAFEVNP